MNHIPVLLNEVLEYLKPLRGKKFIDATYGRGGHSKALLEKGSIVLAIDKDLEGYNECQRSENRFKDRLYCAHGGFADIFNFLRKQNTSAVDGIIFDLGLSSPQIEDPARGFSFLSDGPLDMRMNQSQTLTAADLVNNLSDEELATIIYQYGDERFSRRIAKRIVEERTKEKITRTLQLVEIIRKAVPAKFTHQRIHFATRTFQALRIAVNDELNQLRKGLSGSIRFLKKGGKIAVISFHSKEDRIVKYFFRDQAQKGILKIITKKPIVSSDQEISQNPRSRSAKLRIAEKCS